MVDAFRHRFADVEGVELHWAELGEKTEHPTVVLIHGMCDSHLTWRRLASELARDRQVLMPDLPGCGLSGRPNASYTLDWQAQLIAVWLEQLGLSEVDIVGHSYGGGVAQMLVLACPDRLRRIVLAASGGLGRDVGFWLKFATFPFFVERFGQPFMAFGTRKTFSHVKDGSASEYVASLAAMNAKHGTARAFSRTVRDVINFGGQTRHFLHRAREAQAFPPMAVFWGENDTLIPVAHGRRFVQQVEGAVFQTFPGCGHYVHHEQPTEFAHALRAYLDTPHATPVTLHEAPPAAARSGTVRSLLSRLTSRVGGS